MDGITRLRIKKTWNREGTVTHGTLRTRDLLEALGAELGSVVEDYQMVLEAHDRMRYQLILQELAGLEEGDLDEDEVLAELFDALNEIAPEGYWFGSHEGDGSDIGWWQEEDAED